MTDVKEMVTSNWLAGKSTKIVMSNGDVFIGTLAPVPAEYDRDGTFDMRVQSGTLHDGTSHNGGFIWLLYMEDSDRWAHGFQTVVSVETIQ